MVMRIAIIKKKSKNVCQLKIISSLNRAYLTDWITLVNVLNLPLYKFKTLVQFFISSKERPLKDTENF